MTEPKAYKGKLGDFKPDSRNLNRHTQRGRGMVEASQRQRGFGRPGFAAKDKTMLGGNLSILEVAPDIGLGNGDVFIVETDGDIPIIHLRRDIEPGTDKAILLAAEDNQSALVSIDFDPERLAEEIAQGVDFSGVFTEEEQESILDGLVKEPPEEESQEPPIDKAEELQEKWQCELGQIWQIESKSNPGHYHRLICGDCRDIATVEALTQGEKVNGIFTSPPYAMQRAKQYGGIPENEYVEWWGAVQENVRAVLAEDGSFFVNIKPHCEDGQRALYVFDLVLAMVRRWGWRFIDELCWKRRGYPGDYKNRFKNTFEPIFHFSDDTTMKFRPNNVLKEPELSTKTDSRNSTYREHVQKGKKKSSTGSPFDSSISMIPYNYDEGVRPSNMIEAHLAVENIPQSAQFPLNLPTFFIKAYSDPLDIWLDPFTGSGTVGIAAENEGRLGLMIEQLPKYCAVILERFETQFEIEPELIPNL